MASRLVDEHAARLLLVAAVVAIGLGPSMLAVEAASAQEAPTPRGAEALAADIRESFWKQIDLRLPPFRTVITKWETAYPNSYLAEVDVYDLLFGLGPRKGLLLAVCWAPGRSYSGGWLDVPGNESALRSEFSAAEGAC